VLKESTQEYVVLSDSNVMAAVDFRKVLASHVASGADVTVVAKQGIANGTKPIHFAVLPGEDGIATAMGCNYVAAPEYSASMGMFVVKRQKLIEVINELVPRGNYHLERDFIMSQCNEGKLKLNVYNFQGVSLFNDSVESYYKNNMALLNAEVRNSLFRGEVPIYTKVRDEVPTLYGKTADVGNVVVADGCRLNGNVQNSIIFREVKVEDGAEVKDAIVMQGCVIEKGASVQYTILDKDVTVKSGTKLLGSPEHPLVIRKGVTV